MLHIQAPCATHRAASRGARRGRVTVQCACCGSAVRVPEPTPSTRRWSDASKLSPAAGAKSRPLPAGSVLGTAGGVAQARLGPPTAPLAKDPHFGGEAISEMRACTLGRTRKEAAPRRGKLTDSRRTATPLIERPGLSLRMTLEAKAGGRSAAPLTPPSGAQGSSTLLLRRPSVTHAQ